MAALTDLISPIDTALQTLPSAPSALPTEFRRTHRIPPASVRYQVELHQLAEDEIAASEVKRGVARVVVRIWARPALLSLYTRVTMLLDQAKLYSPAWWRSVDDTVIHSVSAPREEERPSLVGPVIVYAVRVELHVNL